MNACGENYVPNNVLSGHGSIAQIVNGITAKPHSWPSQAAILIKNGDGRTGMCGGTLIDNQTVLTAAQLEK